MSYNKIKCFFGYHDWEYSSWKDEADAYYNLSNFFEKQYQGSFPSRFCQCCFKKQIRRIIDFGSTILWEDTDKLTLKEIRQKKLKNLLNG